ncbi:MAG: hypothetical protein GXY03_01115 [Solirubrobacterales bacterium]|nr:hypothetical protein [Solirubrobacterales bacterium]
MSFTASTRHLAAVAAVAASAALGATVPAPADAGVYTAYHCRTPTGAAASVTDWVAVKRTTLNQIVNSCPSGGPLSMRLRPNVVHPPYDSVRIHVHAPAYTDIRAYSIYRSVRLGSRYNFWRFEYGRSDPVETCHTTGSSCSSLGSHSTPFGSSNLVRASNRSGITGLALHLTCGEDDTKNTSCVATSPAAELEMHRSEVTIFDGHPPRIEGTPTGSLVDPATALTGVHSAWVAASDLGGGVYKALVEIDGEVVSSAVLDDNGGKCVEPFTTVAPCRPSTAGAVSLDTAQLADGPHLLRLLVTDATGTNIGEWGPLRINTANNTCNPSPRIGGARLTAAFRVKGKPKGKRKRARTRSRSTVTVGYDRKLRLRGRLVRDGNAIPGARVCIASRAARSGASLRGHGWLTTDAEGRFSTRLPGGPSRSVYAVHRVAGGAIVDRLRVRVKARLSLKPSRKRLRNGGRVVLSGRLARGPIPSGGVLVQLQARRSTGWQTFGTARTDRRGRYELGYRFSRTTGVQRYQMRALVASQSTYPYATGASKPIALTVSGW